MNDFTTSPQIEIAPSHEHERLEAFRRELACVLNRYSKENASDTPDFILADYMIQCLQAWNNASRLRDKWWSFKPWNDLQISSSGAAVGGLEKEKP